MKQKGKKHVIRVLAMLLILCLFLTSTISDFTPAITIAKSKEQTVASEEESGAPKFELVTGASTTNSTTYQKGDLIKQTKFYGEAVRFFDQKAKKLVDYDATLKRNKGSQSTQGTNLNKYQYENKVGDKKHYLPFGLGKGTPILTEYKDIQMSLTPLTSSGKALITKREGTKAEKETVEDLYGNAKKATVGVTYESEDGTSYRYDSLSSGIRETISLPKLPKTKEIAFTFRLKNAYAEVGGTKPAASSSENAVDVGEAKEKAETAKEPEETIKPEKVADGQEEATDSKNATDDQEKYAGSEETTGSKDTVGQEKPSGGEESVGQTELSAETEVLSGSEIRVFNEKEKAIGILSRSMYTNRTGRTKSDNSYYTLELKKEANKGEDRYRTYRLTIHLDPNDDQDKAEKTPIRMESSMKWLEDSHSYGGDTYVRSSAADSGTNSSGSATMSVGQDGNASVHGYFKFADIETVLKGKYIKEAGLRLTECEGSNSEVDIQLRRITESWSPAALTDANQPAWDKGVLAKLASRGEKDKVQKVDLTGYVTGLVQGTYANEGFVAVASQEADKTVTKQAQFYTGDVISDSNRPVLTVTYYDEPGEPNASLSKVYSKKGEDVSLTWSEAKAPSFSHIEYRIARYHEKETQKIVPYSKATKLGTTEYGKVKIPTASFAEGDYRIAVRSVDRQGNGGKEREVLLHIDSKKPTLSHASITPGTGKKSPGNEAPALTWSGAKDAHLRGVEYRINQGDYTVAGETASGRVTLATAALFSDRVNTIQVRAIDQSGNGSSAKTFHYYYDNVAPNMKEIRLNDSSETDYARQPATITYEVADPYVKEVSVRVNNGASLTMGSTGKGTYEIPESQFPETGVYTIEIQAVDQAGNISRQALPYHYSNTPESTGKEAATPAAGLMALTSFTSFQTLANYSYDFWGLEGNIEDYQPAKLIAIERWDGLTELSWAADNNSFRKYYWGVYYEVYRSTESGFTPSAATLVAGTVKDNYFVLRDNQREKKYYYKVRATLKELDGTLAYASGYSPEASGTTLPEGETSRRQGTKSYLPYVPFSTGNAGGSIEQTQGNLTYQIPSISVPSKELSIAIGTVYNSQSNVDYGMGAGWMLPYPMRVKDIDGAKLLFQDETGAKYELTGDGIGSTYRSADNQDLFIEKKVEMISEREGYTYYELKLKGNVTCRFDERGKIVKMTEPNGDFLTFTYDPYHERLLLITTSTGKSVVFGYHAGLLANGEVRLDKISFPDGSVLNYSYTSGKMTKATLTRGAESVVLGEYGYHSNGMLNKIYDGNANRYDISYQNGMASGFFRPNGDAMTLEYNSSAKQTLVHHDRAGARQYSESTVYDKYGRILSKKDAAGLTTAYEYEAPLFLNLITKEKKEIVAQEVNAEGVVTSKTTTVENTTSYDNHGNVKKEVDEQGNHSAYDYNYTGDNTQDLPSNIKETEAGQAKALSSAEINYDNKGNEINYHESVSQAETKTDIDQKKDGSVIEDEESTDQGLVSSHDTSEYDADGNLTSEAGEAGMVKTKTEHCYDAMGRVIKTEEYAFASKEDETGKINCTTDFTYDIMGRQTGTTTKWASTDANAKEEVESKIYDHNGNVIYEKDKEGVITETTYDFLNRVLSQVTTKNNTTQKTTYQYSYADITVYDGKGGSKACNGTLKTVIKDSNNKVTGTSYTNGLGQVVRSLSGGIYTDYTYDAMGRTIVTYVMGTTPSVTKGKVTCQLYDMAGNVTKTLVNPGKTGGGLTVPPSATPSPTSGPSTTAPAVTMSPSVTKPPVEIPAGYEEVDLSQYTVTGGSGTYQAGKGLLVGNVNSVHFNLPKACKTGDTIKVIVQGSHEGTKNFRSFLATYDLGAASDIAYGLSGSQAIQKTSYGFQWEYTLKATSDSAANLIFKGPDATTDLDHLMIYSLAIKQEPSENARALVTDLTNPANYNKVGNEATAAWNAAESAVKVTTGGYSQGVVFQFILPAGDTLADYESLKYDIKFASTNPVSWKQIRADVATGLDTGSISSEAVDATFGAGTTYNETTTAGREWLKEQSIRFTNPSHYQSKSGKVFIAVGLHAGGSSDNGGNAYDLKNVRLIRKEAAQATASPEATRGPASTKSPALTMSNPVGGPTASNEWAATLTFADCNGYPNNFSSNQYDTLAVKMILYSDAMGTKPIKEVSGKTFSWTKACLNDTGAGAIIYNYGYGDGYIRKYLGDWVPDHLNAVTGEVTVTYDLTAMKAGQNPDCITLQIGDTNDVKAIRLVSMTWNPEMTTNFFVAGNTLVTSKEYDTLGNVTSETDEMGVRTEYRYDEQKRLQAVYLRGNFYDQQQYLYDEHVEDEEFGEALLTRTIHADGTKSTEMKNAAGQVLEVADYNGSKKMATRYTYHTSGNLDTQKQPNGDYIKYHYNEKNQVTSKECFRSNKTLTAVTEYEYNTAGNVTKTKDYTVTGGIKLPLRTELTEYDEFQRKSSFATVDGTDNPTPAQLTQTRITYAYDKESRLIKVTYPKKDGLLNQSFVYNEDGWLMKVTGQVKWVGEQTLREYTYNEMGNVKEIKDSLDYLSGGDRKLVKSYEYDQLQRVAKMEYADSKRVDSQGRPVIQESFAYEYDKKSQIMSETYANRWADTASERFWQKTTYQYDSLNQLTHSEQELTKESGQSQTKQTSYEYSIVGNMTKKTENNVVTTYDYNGLNQLTQSKTGTAVRTYGYDANGNQTSVADSKDSVTTISTYDVENQLSTVSQKGQDGKTLLLQQNQYNGAGQRIGKTMYDNRSGDCMGSRSYIYDGSSVLYATSGASNSMDETGILYVYGGEGNVITGEEYNGYSYLSYGYTKDIRGSTRDLLSEAGQRMATYAYTDFGETSVSGSWGGAIKNQILYTGGMYDSETEQYYLNARFYDPEDGRFLTQDSYRGDQTKSGTWNLYVYCAGNPINYIDPTGHSWSSFWNGVKGAAATAWGATKNAGRGFVDGYVDYYKDLYQFGKNSVKILSSRDVKAQLLWAISVMPQTQMATSTIVDPMELYDMTKAKGNAYTIGHKLGNTRANATFQAAVMLTTKGAGKISKGFKFKLPKRFKTPKSKCFVAGTLIATEKGLNPIEEIKVGQLVYSENPETGEKGLKKVVQTFVRETDELVHINIDGESISATLEHPFYVLGKGWTNAVDLREGEILVTVNGEYKVVGKIQYELLDTPIKVYNFEVEDLHTYFVSESSILVHNANCGGMNSSQAKAAAEKLGFKKIKETSHGSPIFRKGNKYITPDNTVHNGGVWKMADSVKNLKNRTTRMGTYDANLKRIGD